jgi:hypothetical protein
MYAVDLFFKGKLRFKKQNKIFNGVLSKKNEVGIISLKAQFRRMSARFFPQRCYLIHKILQFEFIRLKKWVGTMKF